MGIRYRSISTRIVEEHSREYIEHVYNTKTVKEASKILGCSIVTLYKIIEQEGIQKKKKINSPPAFLDMDIDTVREALGKYGSCRNAERSLGISRGRLYNLSKHYGIKLRSQGFVGVVQRHTVQRWWDLLLEGKHEEVIDEMGDKLVELSERFDK